ncbi:MAG: hypothetical protein AB8B91_20940 [Rubripirellula sp.]
MTTSMLIAYSDFGLLIAVLCGYGIFMGVLFTHWVFQRRSRRRTSSRRTQPVHSSESMSTARGVEVARLSEQVAALHAESEEADQRLHLLEEQVELLQKIVVEQASVLVQEPDTLVHEPTVNEPEEEAAVPVLSIFQPLMDKYGSELVVSDPDYGVVFSERPEQVDDLTRIWGIGAVNQDRLYEQGVYRFQQIIDWEDHTIENFNNLLGFKGRIEREDWVGQANGLVGNHAERRAA